MNFWGIDRNGKPDRFYIEVGDPSDDTIMTSMYLVDLRLGRKPTTFAWWASRAASSIDRID